MYTHKEQPAAWIQRMLLVPLLLLHFFTACQLSEIPKPPSVEQITNTAYISSFVEVEGAVYFGSGHCLNHLDTENGILTQLVCSDDKEYHQLYSDREVIYGRELSDYGFSSSYFAFDTRENEFLWRNDLIEHYSSYPYEIYTIEYDNRIVSVQPCTKGSGHCVKSYIKTTGDLIWESKVKVITDTKLDLLDSTNTLLVFGYLNETKGFVEIAIDSGKKNVLYRNTDLENLNAILHHDQSSILGVYYAPAEAVTYIKRFDRATEQLLWSLSGFEAYSFDLICYEDDSILITSGRKIWKIDLHEGRVLWEIDPNTKANPQITIESKDSIVVESLYIGIGTNSTHWLVAFDQESGSIAWRTEVLANNKHVLTDESVIVAYQDTLLAYDRLTGDLLWQLPIDTTVERIIDYL